MAMQVPAGTRVKCTLGTSFGKAILVLVLGFGLAGAAAADDYPWGSERAYCGDPPRFHRHVHHNGHKHRHPRKHVEVRHEHHHYYHEDPEPVRYRRGVYYEPPAQHYAPAVQRTRVTSVGSLLGAALGGFLGSHLGKGDGNLAATAAGTVAGYVIGGEVGGSQYRY